jgi:hypothetical protein
VRNSVAAAAILVLGCSAPHRTLTLVPTLPPCAAVSTVNTVRVTAQGDFPPEATLTAAASPSTAATLTLPRTTRDVVVEGFGPTGLAAFGRTATLSLDDAPGGPLGIAYGPPDGVCATGDMQVARAGHHATTLSDGGVLVTGGVNGGDGPATQVERYDPRTASFALSGASLDPRAVLLHAAVALGDGGALVSGGAGNDANGAAAGIAVDFATRFDAAGVRVGKPSVLAGGPRAGHSATVLADGRVLLAGGCQQLDAGSCRAGATLASTELYDPKADLFAPGPPLAHARFGHDAVLRGDGTVLIVGGRAEGGGALPAEVVDPDEARSFDAGLASGRAAALPTGSVLVAGGASAPDTAASLWLSPSETLPLPPLREARVAPTLTLLDDGAVLVAGGGNEALALYDGRAALATLTAATPGVRDLAAARLADGTVLLAGGVDATATPTAKAVVYFHSPLSPWASLPPLTLDGASDPYLPRRPDRASAGGGQLVVAAATAAPDGRPAELALVAGMQVADFTFDVLAGRRGAAGAAIVVGWQSEAAYAFAIVEPGRPVELWSVTSPRAGQSLAAPVAHCAGDVLPDGALPDGDLAALEVAWRAGTLTVSAAGVALLRCSPPALPRGAVGVGALHGTAAFDNLALTR